MKTKLIIAAIACLGLAACQQQAETPKEEKAHEHASTPAEHSHSAEHTAPAAAPTTEHPAGHTDQPAAPTAPGASYYDNNPSQNLAEQANPAIDTQQQTAQTQAETQEND